MISSAPEVPAVILHVAARAEHVACTREHDGPRVRMIGELAKHDLQPAMHGSVDGISALGTVQRHERDPVGDLDLDVMLAVEV